MVKFPERIHGSGQAGSSAGPVRVIAGKRSRLSPSAIKAATGKSTGTPNL
jgi:hypothetical protein